MFYPHKDGPIRKREYQACFFPRIASEKSQHNLYRRPAKADKRKNERCIYSAHQPYHSTACSNEDPCQAIESEEPWAPIDDYSIESPNCIPDNPEQSHDTPPTIIKKLVKRYAFLRSIVL